MPTYEYECQRCGHHFERFQGMTEEPVKRCPECRGKVKRVFSGGAGFLFKGSGFHETDYRSAEYKRRAKEDSGGGASKDGSKDATKDATGGKKDGPPSPPAR